MPYTEYIFLFKFCKKIYEQKFEKIIKNSWQILYKVIKWQQ